MNDDTRTYVVHVTCHENGETWNDSIESVCAQINDSLAEFQLAISVRPLSEVIAS